MLEHTKRQVKQKIFMSMDYVCNRCLFSIPSKVEMAEEQDYLQMPR